MTELSLPFAIPAANLHGTRSSNNWSKQPQDTLNTRVVWGRVGKYGIPCLEPTDFIPDMLAAWHDPQSRADAATLNGAIHFFLDDYRFERVWTKPAAAFDRIETVGAALTPDFSIWRDMPLAMQIWQTYRARWVGAYWQYNGIEVIPTVSWGDPETYEFCFEGLPENGTLAISSVGVRGEEATDYFKAGVDAMMATLHPTDLIVYGKLPFDLDTRIHTYPTFWEQRQETRNGR